MNKLEGKVAVITGGSTGIGLATAKRFTSEGAHVYVTGRRQSELDEAVTEIGENAIGVQGDVSNLADLDRLYAKVKEQKAASTSCSPTPALWNSLHWEQLLNPILIKYSTSTSKDFYSPYKKRFHYFRTAMAVQSF